MILSHSHGNLSFHYSSLSKLLVLTICLIGFNGISQEKVVDQQAQLDKLALVEETIQKLDEKISSINNRLTAVPPGAAIDPAVMAKLDALNQEKKRYEDIKFSIDALINPGNVTQVASEQVEIPRSQFELMPIENQTQILAHPERFTVIDNQ